MRAWLDQRFGERVRFAEPLSRHTSFRIGGPADAWVEASSADDIVELQRAAADAGVALAVLGIGTNVLVSDRGVRGVVLKLGRAFGELEWRSEADGMRVRAGAAAPFKKLVMDAAARHLTGLEFAEGIPGSIGGGLLMNAGAFGGEIANVVTGIVGVAPDGGERYLPREELRFGYRRFDLPPNLIVTRVDFALARGDVQAIRATMAGAKRKRDAKQPLGWPNAGSIFKNPPGDYAGRLIEGLGLKGRRVGGAMISEQHANFIVNHGGATAADVDRLIRRIQVAVSERCGVALETEVEKVGRWKA